MAQRRGHHADRSRIPCPVTMKGGPYTIKLMYNAHIGVLLKIYVCRSPLQNMTEWGEHLSEMTNKQLVGWIVFGVVLILSPALQLWDAGTVSWLALGGVFIATVVFSETAATTRPGQRIDAWWRRIGIPGRTLAIVLFAVVAWGSIWLYSGSLIPLYSFVFGGFLGIIVKGSFVLMRRIEVPVSRA